MMILANLHFNKSSDLFSNVDPQNNLEKFIQFPLIRLLIVSVLLLPVPLIIGLIRNYLNLALNQTLALYLGYSLDVILIALLILFLSILENS